MFTGLRRGELIALRWRDVDFERSSIRVSDGGVTRDLITAPVDAARVVWSVEAHGHSETSRDVSASRSARRSAACACRWLRPNRRLTHATSRWPGISLVVTARSTDSTARSPSAQAGNFIAEQTVFVAIGLFREVELVA